MAKMNILKLTNHTFFNDKVSETKSNENVESCGHAHEKMQKRKGKGT